MKFRITATSVWWQEHEKLIEEYPILSNYGYELEEKQIPVSGCWIKDENGKRIWQTTDKTRPIYTPYIHIDTLEQLVEFIKALEDCGTIVMTEDEIEIYDGYRE